MKSSITGSINSKNPSLGEIFSQFQNNLAKNDDSLADLETYIRQSGMSRAQTVLLEKLKSEISKGDSFEAEYTIKGLKRIPAFRKDAKAQRLIQAVNADLDHQHGPSTHEKALFYLCESIDAHRGYGDPLAEVQDKLSAPAFELYVAFQTVGNANSDGWAHGVFGNCPVLVPYVSRVMKLIGFDGVGQKFLKVERVFPTGTSFSSDDPCYTKILTFLENPRFKLEGIEGCIPQGLNRDTLHANYVSALQELDDVWESTWDEDLEWKAVYDLYDAHLDAKIWR